jgi:hypothetical protein
LNSHTRQALGIAGLLLAAALVAACGRGATGVGAGVAPTPSAVATAPATATPEPSDAASPATTFSPGTAIGAVDTDLTDLNQFLSGLDSSLGQSDGQA